MHRRGRQVTRRKEASAETVPLHSSCKASVCPLHDTSISACCRIHALFYTDRICCEPLTEWVHFTDLRHGQPGYMLYLVRIMDAFGKLCSALSSAMVPYADAGPAFGQAREQQLTDGIPYMLRDPRQALTPHFLHRIGLMIMHAHLSICQAGSAMTSRCWAMQQVACQETVAWSSCGREQRPCAAGTT